MSACSHNAGFAAAFASVVLCALTLFPTTMRAQPIDAGDVVLELRDGGFVRGRLISGADRSGELELLRVDGARVRYARSELLGVSAHEPRGLVDVHADRVGLFLELVEGPETPQVAVRMSGIATSPSMQMEAMPAVARSNRLRLCAVPCTLSLASGVYQFALGTTGIDATPPLRPVFVTPGDTLNLRYVDGQPARTSGLVLFATAGATLLGSTVLLLGPAYGLDEDLSLGLFVGLGVAAVVQAVLGIVLLLRDDDALIEVRPRPDAARATRSQRVEATPTARGTSSR